MAKQILFITWMLLSNLSANEAVVKESVSKIVQNQEVLKKDYAKSKNAFLKALKHREDLENVKIELKQLKKELKKSIRSGNIKNVQELDDNKQILESKLEILTDKHQRIYQKITKITANSEPFNFMNFFSKKPLKNVDNAINSLINLRLDYQHAVEEVDKFSKKLKLQINEEANKSLQKHLKTQLGSVLQDQRYLYGFKDLIEKQYEHLLEQRTATESRYFEYRDSEILKHLISLIVVIVLFVLVFILRQLTIHFIKEDERQFIYRRTISTSAIVIGLAFILISYSENIVYAMTIFTFIGAAIVIATRTFLLNIVAWMNIILSKFIKVGDRVLIPHETKYYHGDVISISPVRITLYEAYDFSSTRVAVNAGRIVFVPNNYIFSHGVINYSHQGQKSFFDFLSFNLSFESDLARAEAVTREIISEHTEQFLIEAKEQFSRLKKRYAIKQRMLEPEIQFTINSASSAVTMTAWYIAPNHQATALKNTLLKALIRRFNEEDTIDYTRKAKPESKEPEESSES